MLILGTGIRIDSFQEAVPTNRESTVQVYNAHTAVLHWFRFRLYTKSVVAFVIRRTRPHPCAARIVIIYTDPHAENRSPNDDEGAKIGHFLRTRPCVLSTCAMLRQKF